MSFSLLLLLVHMYDTTTICLDAKHRPIKEEFMIDNCVYMINQLPRSNIDEMPDDISVECNNADEICYGCCFNNTCQKVKTCTAILRKKRELTTVFFLVVSMGMGFMGVVIVVFVGKQQYEALIEELTRVNSEVSCEQKIRAQYSFAYLQEHADRLSFFDIDVKVRELNSVHSLNVKLN